MKTECQVHSKDVASFTFWTDWVKHDYRNYWRSSCSSGSFKQRASYRKFFYQWDLSVFQYNWGYRLGVIIEREREGVYVCLYLLKKKKNLKKKGCSGTGTAIALCFYPSKWRSWVERIACRRIPLLCVFLKIRSFPSNISQILEIYFNIYWLLRNNTRPRNLWGLHFTWAVFFYSVFLCSFLCLSLVWKLPKLLLAATL